MDNDISELRASISLLFKKLRNRMSVTHTYSMTEILIFSSLSRNPGQLPSELATQVKVTPQTMSQLLKRMQKEGLIFKEAAPDDGRKTLISLTEKGFEWVEKARYERDEWLKQAINDRLTPEEKTTLKTIIPILKKLIEYE